MSGQQVRKRKPGHKPLKAHRLRHKIADRDGWICCFCQRLTECPSCYPDAPIVGTLDHILPRSQGGTNAFINLRIACSRCNQARGIDEEVSVDEFERLNDANKPVAIRGWQRKRHQVDDPDNPQGSCSHSKPGAHRRPPRVWPDEEAAQAQADIALITHGVLLEPYLHRRCERWHLKRASLPDLNSHKEQKGASNE